jgi:lipoprotein NlpI
LVGIVTAKLNAARVAKFTGDIPQNVNFALKSEVARTFLDSKGIAYRKAPSDQQLSPADVGDIARPFTVYLKCKQDVSRSAAATPAASNPAPASRTNPTPQQINMCLKGNLSPDVWIDGFNLSPDLRIDSCTALIYFGQSAGKNLSTVFNNRGLAYQAKGRIASAMSDWSEAIRLDPTNPAPYLSRGLVYIAQGDQYRAVGGDYVAVKEYDLAIADLNGAIRNDPKPAKAFNARGTAFSGKANYDRAIVEYSQAIKIDPTYELAYRNRGTAYRAKADYDHAMADWTKVLELTNKPYWILWRYIERGRAGASGDAELAGNVVRVKTRDWPYPVAEFYLGRRSAAEMLGAATKPNEQCEAQFYLGEWHLLHANRAAATAALRIAANTCPKDFFEYDGAIAELTRLNR